MSIRRLAAVTFGALALASQLAGCPSEPAKAFPHAVLTPAPAKELAAVPLTGEDGQPFKVSDLKGKWVWLYFGFTHCPDVCPAAMDYMAQEYNALKHKDRVVPLFVSVDPNRDTAMTSSFLQASLFTSVVAFGVAAMAIAVGIAFVLFGLALREPQPTTAHAATA